MDTHACTKIIYARGRSCSPRQNSVVYGNAETSSMHRRLGSTTLSQLAFPGESDPYFQWEISQWDSTVVQQQQQNQQEEENEYAKCVSSSMSPKLCRILSLSPAANGRYTYFMKCCLTLSPPPQHTHTHTHTHTRLFSSHVVNASAVNGYSFKNKRLLGSMEFREIYHQEIKS